MHTADNGFEKKNQNNCLLPDSAENCSPSSSKSISSILFTKTQQLKLTNVIKRLPTIINTITQYKKTLRTKIRMR